MTALEIPESVVTKKPPEARQLTDNHSMSNFRTGFTLRDLYFPSWTSAGLHH